MSGLESAVAAGGARFREAEVDATQRLVTFGTTEDPDASWAADPETVEMVAGPPTRRTSPGNAPRSTPRPTSRRRRRTPSGSGHSRGTAQLGPGRHDLFTRMRLGVAMPAFAEGYAGGVADPTTGRIGYQMTDPPTAAAMALAKELPFAACD